MNTHERLIRERFARQRCASCGAQLTPESVLVLARRSNAWLLMVTCAGCQHRGIYVASFPTSGAKPLGFSRITISPAPTTKPTSVQHDPDALDVHDLFNTPDTLDTLNSAFADLHDRSLDTLPDITTTPHRPIPSTTSPITPHDVTEMRDFLSTFNGDFHHLFAHSRKQRHEPPPAND